jgi:hypothetical protein
MRFYIRSKGGDIIESINDKKHTLDNIYDMISESQMERKKAILR